jgi:hypothetical protein
VIPTLRVRGVAKLTVASARVPLITREQKQALLTLQVLVVVLLMGAPPWILTVVIMIPTLRVHLVAKLTVARARVPLDTREQLQVLPTLTVLLVVLMLMGAPCILTVAMVIPTLRVRGVAKLTVASARVPLITREQKQALLTLQVLVVVLLRVLIAVPWILTVAMVIPMLRVRMMLE